MGDLLRWTGCHHITAGIAALGTQIDDPVGGFDDIHIVLDHQHRVSAVDQTLQRGQQRADVGEMQAGGGLVKYEQFALLVAGTIADKARKFEALGLPAGHGVDRLAQSNIAQSHVGQGLQCRNHFPVIGEKRQRLIHRHGQNVMDVVSPVAHIQHFGFEALSLAVRTENEDIGEKLHLHFFESIAFAGFTASAGHIKGEIAGAEIAGPGPGSIRQQPPDRIQGFGVGQGVGPGCAADGPLIHQHDVVDIFQPPDGAVQTRAILLVSQGFLGGLVKNIFRQRGFARAGHAGQTDEQSQGDAHVDFFQVVFGRAFDRQPPVISRRAPLSGNGDFEQAFQILAGKRPVDAGGRAEIHDLAAPVTGFWTEVQQIVAFTNDLRIVFHHHDGIR